MIKPPATPVTNPHEDAKFIFVTGSSAYLNTTGFMKVINIISGAAKAEINGTQKTLFTGESLVINPYESVYVEILGGGYYYSFVVDQVKHFDSLCIPALTKFENFIPSDRIISDICKKINYEYNTRNHHHENMLVALTNELLIHLYRSYNAGSTTEQSALLLGKHKIARLAVDYIYKHSTDGISTNEVSNAVNVSESYLCRCFKEATGVSVLEYAERIRCRKAKEDLSLGIYTVTQIAEKYNFNSLSYFSRRYKKYCGENPVDTLSEAKKRRS